MRHFRFPSAIVRTLRISPDGGSLYAVTEAEDGREPGSALFRPLCHHLYRIDCRTGAPTGQWELHGSRRAVFSPDLRAVYCTNGVESAGTACRITRLDLYTSEWELLVHTNDFTPGDMALTPNEHLLAVAGSDWGLGAAFTHRIWFFDLWHGTRLEPLQTNFSYLAASALAYSGDGQLLAAAALGGDLVIWRGRRQADWFPGPAAAIQWSAVGHLGWIVADRSDHSGATDRVAVARQGGGERVRFTERTGGRISGFAFAPDERRILTSSLGGSCSLHDMATGRLTASFDWRIGPIHSVAFSPDGLTCAAGGENGQLVVWDVDG